MLSTSSTIMHATNAAPGTKSYSGIPQPSLLRRTLTKTGPRSQIWLERRRIQNRIAQRDCRKKLKKRLEDLVSSCATIPCTAWNAVLIELQERCAASSSASPEQKLAELQPPQRSPRQEFSSPSSLESSYTTPPAEDRMFSHQYTRQLSTSPLPFSVMSYSSTCPAPNAVAYRIPYSTAPDYKIPITLTPEMPRYTYLPLDYH
jgi:hypothetical protein